MPQNYLEQIGAPTMLHSQMTESEAANIVQNVLNNATALLTKSILLLEGKSSIPCWLLSMCVRHQIRDSQLVSRVLEFTWDFLCDFSLLFRRQWLRSLFNSPFLHERHIWYKEFLSEDYDIETQVYFLEHANIARLELDGNRLVDILYGLITSPLEKAISAYNVDAVLLLLKYGCEIQLSKLDHLQNQMKQNYLSRKICLNNIRKWDTAKEVGILFRRLRTKYFKKRGTKRKAADGNLQGIHDFSDRLEINTEINLILGTIRVLLRAIPQMDTKLVYFEHEGEPGYENRVSDQRGTEERSLKTKEDSAFLKTLNYHVPQLWERTKCSSSLVHLCRCEIRRLLNEQWRLPSGINELPLPQTTKNYLNLERDEWLE